MPYPIDFADASIRHGEDAERLFAENRLANADHLYGLSAECGLKAIMTDWGREELNPEYRLHVNELWYYFILWYEDEYVRSEAIPTEAVAWMRSRNPFGNWEIANRYARSGCFREEDVRCYREAAQAVLDMMLQSKGITGRGL